MPVETSDLLGVLCPVREKKDDNDRIQHPGRDRQ